MSRAPIGGAPWMSRFLIWVLLLASGTPLVVASEPSARPPSENGVHAKAAMPSTGDMHLKSLRLAIEDLIATLGQRYPRRPRVSGEARTA